MTPVVCFMTLGSSCESRTTQPFPFVQPGWQRVHANVPRSNRRSGWNADIILPSRKSEAIRFRTMQGWPGTESGCNFLRRLRPELALLSEDPVPGALYLLPLLASSLCQGRFLKRHAEASLWHYAVWKLNPPDVTG